MRATSIRGTAPIQRPALAAALVVATLGLLFSGGATAKLAAADATLRAHLEATTALVDPRAATAMRRIDGTDRRLLALRAYLRSARQIDERWSWTRAELAAFEGSRAQARYDATLAQVRCIFESRHPGYTLYANPQARSLESQLQSWNANASVKRAAARMRADIARTVARPGFPRAGTVAGREAFRGLLVDYRPSPVPTLAAPGLSRHGRMQAIDFQVRRGEHTVAAPRAATAASVWRAGGWSARLDAAIRVADVGLIGPLRSPDEPWHYELPASASNDAIRFARVRPATDDACT